MSLRSANQTRLQQERLTGPHCPRWGTAAWPAEWGSNQRGLKQGRSGSSSLTPHLCSRCSPLVSQSPLGRARLLLFSSVCYTLITFSGYDGMTFSHIRLSTVETDGENYVSKYKAPQPTRIIIINTLKDDSDYCVWDLSGSSFLFSRSILCRKSPEMTGCLYLGYCSLLTLQRQDLGDGNRKSMCDCAQAICVQTPLRWWTSVSCPKIVCLRHSQHPFLPIEEQ